MRESETVNFWQLSQHAVQSRVEVGGIEWGGRTASMWYRTQYSRLAFSRERNRTCVLSQWLRVFWHLFFSSRLAPSTVVVLLYLSIRLDLCGKQCCRCCHETRVLLSREIIVRACVLFLLYIARFLMRLFCFVTVSCESGSSLRIVSEIRWRRTSYDWNAANMKKLVRPEKIAGQRSSPTNKWIIRPTTTDRLTREMSELGFHTAL